MKKIILACLLLGSLLFALPAFTETLPVPKCPLEAQNAPIQAIIEYHACMYDIDPKPLLKVAYCESRYKPNAINYHDGGKGKHSVGIFQFQKRTFDYWEDKLGEDLDYYSAYDQAKLASYMFKKNQQFQWSCSKIVGII